MEGIVRHEANNSYLIVKEGEQSKQEEFLLRMITENQIPGLLKVTRHQMNGERELYYHINDHMSLGEYCEKKQLGQKDLRNLLLGLCRILSHMEEYLLNVDTLVLEPDFLFLSSSKEEMAFCLYPFSKKEIRQQIREMGEYLLNHINHEEEDVVRMAYQFYRLTRQENFEIIKVIEELLRDTHTTHTTDTIEEKEPMEFQLQPDTLEYKTNAPSKLIFVCFSVASFLFFLYTCFLKSYYYGYSFFRMLSTNEVKVGLGVFIISLIMSVLFVWWQRKKKKKEVVEVSGA